MRRLLNLVIVALALFSLPLTAEAAKTHKLKRNETLASLAAKYHVSVAELKEVNRLTGSQVKRGTILIIPVPSSKGNLPGEVAETRIYKAKKGETLASIAKKTGVSVFELKRLNGLTKNRVKAGQVLALREADHGRTGEAVVAAVQSPRLQLRHPDLFSEKEYENTLAELVEPDADGPVNLQQNVELNPENMKMLKRSAFGFLGTRYRFGGTTKRGLDCSSFVQQVFRELDVNLPRTAREQFAVGSRVSSADLQKGDLVFFRTYASFPSHVGIYLGNNRMIHASSRDRRVVISSLNTPYYRSRYLGAKRVDKINPTAFNLDELISAAEEEIAGDEEQNDNLGVTSSVSSNK